MSTHDDDHAGPHDDHQLLFLEELVDEHAIVSGDLIEIDSHTWAIHGSVAVDGEVIMAEYSSAEEARFVLGELHEFEVEREGDDLTP
jgi:hypothetical protein